MPLFDSEFLKKLEYLSLVSRRVFRGQLLAQRRTMQMGGGIEFADHRDYTPGDDLRYLDWNVFARLGEPLLKRFQEEEDLHVYLFLDCSRSMGFGDPSKFDYARRITAALAYIGLADLDRVSVSAFAGDLLDSFPLTRGKERILTLLQFLEQLESQGTVTDLARVTTGFVHRRQRPGLAIVISDLFDPAGFQRGVDILRHRRFETHLVQICDRRELEPDLAGDVELYDVETGDTKKVTVTERKLRQYRTVFGNFQKSVESYCRKYGLGCTRTTTDVPFDELILQMMRTAGAVM
ncbi:MAG: DUF58 domain-containing protein [Thermoguttaceae bacterium]